MGYVLTNKTAQTPLGFGALGVAIQAGESFTVTDAQAKLLQGHPVIDGWVAEGKLTVEPAEDPEAARAAAEEAQRQATEEEAAKLAAAAPKVEPPKVPVPTKR